jgi:amino acid transporter
VSYWWGWVPTCGFTAILSATALHQWYLPFIPVTPLAVGIVLIFLGINLLGVRAVTRVAIPVACVAALLALLSAVVPLVSGSVDLHRAVSFDLKTPSRLPKAVSRGVWRFDFGDGGAVPRRLRRAGL